MSTRDISENIQEIYGFGVSAETISNITNRVLVDVKEWQSRALKPTYAVVFMDGMVFKVKKDGVIRKYTAYAYIGVDLEGQKDGKFPRQRSLREEIFVTEVRCSGSEEFANAVRLLAPAPRWFEIR